MSKTDYEYDPDFPYVTRSGVTGYVSGRFPTRENAEKWTDGDEWVEIIDTTPKPKIPEDARFVHWFVRGGNFIATREGFNPLKPWELEGVYYTEESLLKEIGDAEVTVLVRKEES